MTTPFPIPLPERWRPLGYRCAMGVDTGFVSDSSTAAVVIAHGHRYVLADLEELRPKPGAPLKPSEVARMFATMAGRYEIRSVMGDLHYSEAMREHLNASGIGLVAAPAGQPGKVAVYSRARDIIREGRVKLPQHPRLIAQLKSIMAKPTAGGTLSITAPRRSGHGDLVSAVVLALWSASENAGGGVTVADMLEMMKGFEGYTYARPIW